MGDGDANGHDTLSPVSDPEEIDILGRCYDLMRGVRNMLEVVSSAQVSINETMKRQNERIASLEAQFNTKEKPPLSG